MKNPRMDNLQAKILSEDYCCLHGYLRLCKARGEKVPNMAEWIGMHRYTLYYHYRALAQGKRPCLKLQNCLLPVVATLEPAPTSSDPSK